MALGTPVAAAAAYNATAGGTTVTPAYPAGILATDVVLLFVGQKPSTANGGTVTTPTGWTLRDSLTAAGGYGTTLGADTGNTNLFVYSWNTPVAGQTGNLTVTLGTNNISWAFMVRIPSGGGALSYGSADGQRTTAPTVNVAFATALTNGATATDFQSGDVAIWAMCIPTDVTTPGQFSAPSVTATGATFGAATELNEPDSGTGNDIGGYSAWASVTSGSSTTAPTVTVTAGGTVTNVRGPIVLLRVREGPAPQALTPNLFTNDQTFHNPTVTRGTITLTPALYTNDQTFYDPTITQGGNAQDLTLALFTNNQTFYGPTVAASNTLTPALYTNDQTFYAPTVTLGGAAQTLTPDLYTNDQTFYGPTASASNTLTPALYTNTQTFYDPTVAASNALTPNRYENTQTFYGPVVLRGAVTLTPDLYTNDQTFFAPTVTAGTITLSPPLVTNEQTFYSAIISQSGGLQTLLPDLYTNTQTFFAPTVTPGVVTLAPQGYVDDGYVDTGYFGPNTFSTQVFYAPTVVSVKTLQPALVSNTQTFFSPTVENSLYTITRAQALKLLQVHLLHGLGAAPLVVGPTSRTAGAVQQTVTQAGATVVIDTTSAPSSFVGDPGELIEELAALHGLGVSLEVTATTRTAGLISQTMVSAGGVTTVTRV